MKKLSDFLAGIPMTIVGGVFLGASLIFMLLKIEVPFDPAWVSVIICGVPLLAYKGMSKISSALSISMAMIAAISPRYICSG